MKLKDIMSPAELAYVLEEERQVYLKSEEEGRAFILFLAEETSPYFDVIDDHCKNVQHAAGMTRMLAYIAFTLSRKTTK